MAWILLACKRSRTDRTQRPEGEEEGQREISDSPQCSQEMRKQHNGGVTECESAEGTPEHRQATAVRKSLQAGQFCILAQPFVSCGTSDKLLNLSKPASSSVK